MPTVVETFEHIIRHQGPAELVPFLMALEKGDVVPVRLRTLKLQFSLYDEKQTDMHRWRGITETQHLLFFLAGLATYSRKEALSWGSMNLLFLRSSPRSRVENDPTEFVTAVLDHFKPEWLTAWLIKTAQDNPWVVPSFTEIFGLINRGLVAADGWLLAQATVHQLRNDEAEAQVARTLALQAQTGPALHPIQEQMLARLQIAKPLLVATPTIPTFEELLLAGLQDNTTLLQQGIPLLFEYDTQVDYLLQTKLSWSDVLLRLVATGHLDRADLLTRCLLALRRDFRRPLLTWFKELFLALQPTQAERLALRNELLELLPHTQTLVVNFALDQMKDLLPEPSFPPTLLLPYADSLFLRADLKTALRTLLAGLLKLPKQDIAHAPAVAQLLAAALPHPDATVQERAAKGLAGILESKKPLLNAEETAAAVVAISSHAELLAAAARTTLAAWLAPVAPTPAPAETATYAPAAAQFVPEISAATAIAPVADWHELLFLTGQALQQDNPIALERWVDGLLRLNGQLPAHYATSLEPYMQQLVQVSLAPTTVAGAWRHSPTWSLNGESGLLKALLVGLYEGFTQSWVAHVALVRGPISTFGTYAFPMVSDPLSFVNQHRMAFAESLLATAQPLPLLSTFTHAPHFIAPDVLVEKLLLYQREKVEPNLADLTLALARTAWAAPAAATAARQLLPALEAITLRQLLEWFFTPESVPAATPLANTEQPLVAWPTTPEEAGRTLWAIAIRTKYPLAVLPWLDAAEATADLQGPIPMPLARPYHSPTSAEPSPRPGGNIPANTASGLLLYSVHQAMQPRYAGVEGWWDGHEALHDSYQRLYSLVPQHAEPFFQHTLRCAVSADNLATSDKTLLDQALKTMLEAGPGLGQYATQLLAGGLLHHTTECRRLAQEVLLRAIADGRLLPVPLGETLGRQLAAGYAPVPRLADGLAALTSIDALTDDALTQVLETLLAALPTAPPRNTGKLLEAYAALSRRTARPLPAAVQARLREWQAVASLKKAGAALLA